MNRITFTGSKFTVSIQTQQHVDRRAAIRTASSLIVHFVSARLTKALWLHGISAMRVSRGCTRQTSQNRQQLSQLIRSMTMPTPPQFADTWEYFLLTAFHTLCTPAISTPAFPLLHFQGPRYSALSLISVACMCLVITRQWLREMKDRLHFSRHVWCIAYEFTVSLLLLQYCIAI